VNHWRSSWLGPNVYWHRLLGEHYGGLGPIGVSASHRGRGLGLALLCHSVAHLRDLGVRRMCIDWTNLLDFYGKIGFAPWKEYVHVGKTLG
jgi:predicted N-acetyltransferase YhbS